MMAVNGMVNLVGSACDQVAERSELLFLHELTLQRFWLVVCAAGLLEQRQQGLILEVLAQEDEGAQAPAWRPGR